MNPARRANAIVDEGNARNLEFIPKGFHHQSPGLRASATLGLFVKALSTLKGLHPDACGPRLLAFIAICTLCLLAPFVAHAEPSWKIRFEEPTGVYRRDQELARVALDRLPGQTGHFLVTDPAGRELPWQIADRALLFPVTCIPGELPEYTVTSTGLPDVLPFVNGIHLRRIGLYRIELGNDRFRVTIDTHLPAITEAYSLSAGPQRMLNLVETTPEDRGALTNDIHLTELTAANTGADPVPGENGGWTSLGATGPLSDVEIIENGPLQGRVRLGRDGEVWQLTWDAHSAALRWKAGKGFRFAAISAAPYLPFNRFSGGSEYEWPTGPDGGEPPDAQIGARSWKQLPGNHAVYYQQEENYGALGIVALDTNLTWTAIGSRRFIAQRDGGPTEIALTFPRWDAGNTVLEARKEYQILHQPLIPLVVTTNASALSPSEHATRVAAVTIEPREAPAAAVVDDRLPLSGPWDLMWTEKMDDPPLTGWRTVQVPGTAHVQWLPPSDIYSRAAEWISSKAWWYRKRIRVPESFRGKRLRLQFEATDYYADIRWNGQLIGHHEGYMDPYELDVTDRAHFGEDNELLVRLWAPVHYYWKHRSYTIKGSYGAVDQKPDDITALGITRPVWLKANDPVWIGDIATATTLVDEHRAELAVDVDLAGEPDSALTWQLSLAPRNFESPQRYTATTGALKGPTHLVIPVDDPQLWWTWDHGKPNLYTLEARLLDAAGNVMDRKALAVGLREIEKVGWDFYLNRRRMFIRGSNYYYHLYMSEMTRASYERDLKLMLGMNINMLRLHCHFSNPELYDLADESGLLLWQDYLEAWYPEDRAFSLRAAALYDPLIRSVRNHPSVALWTTCDEESLENYRDLTKHLAPRPPFLDPQRRPVVRSTGRYGDAHVYHGWYGGTIWEYTQMSEAFVSELGATSLPNYETLIKFMPDQWPIDQHPDEWFFRRLQIPEAMRAWGSPDGLTLREYIPRTQAYVARLFQIALERMRRIKYHPAGGVLHFHAIDIWPSVTMAAIDFDRVPTQVYDTVRRSFEPVLASIEYDRDRWPAGAEVRCGIWAINDRWTPVPNAGVHWHIAPPGADTPLAQGDWTLTLPADSSQRLGDAVWHTASPGNYELRTQVRTDSGALISENIFQFRVAP